MKKELGLFDVYALATGATLSSGFFLLPGIAAATVGSALPLAYLVAALFLLPGLLSNAELATAMPRSGGVYFFLDRSMGPLWGTMSGFGTWCSLILKTSFALVGVGAYLGLFFPDLPLEPLAAGLAIVFGMVNLLGAKKSGVAQVFLVIGLLVLLAWFSGLGFMNLKAGHFSDMLAIPGADLIATAGLVVVSYMGLTNVASLAGEVKNPERNLPLGMFLAYATAVVVYMVGTTVMIGVVGSDALSSASSLYTPVATVAEEMAGRLGSIVMTVAAVLAFTSVANAGILSASRYPMAMSRDKLLPAFLSKLTKGSSVPVYSILLTAGIIIIFVTVVNPMKIAKLASSFQLLMFAMSATAVIVMREARLDSYDPRFKSPLYPWLHIVGVIAPIWLIFQMGSDSILFTCGLLLFGALWYRYYASSRVQRSGAIFHIFERLGRSSSGELDRELRGILKEKGLRAQDPFDEIIARSFVFDVTGSTSFDAIVHRASGWLSDRIPMDAENISLKFLEGTRMGATPVTHGVALPHLSIEGVNHPEMVIVRVSQGVTIQAPDLELSPEKDESTVTAIFFLVSPKSDPGQHLRILAQIARRVDGESFDEDWKNAESDQDLKEVLLKDDHFLYMTVSSESGTSSLLGKSLREVHLPPGNLIPIIHRSGENIIPTGDTILEEGDHLTVLGDPDFLRSFKKKYSGTSDNSGTSETSENSGTLETE